MKQPMLYLIISSIFFISGEYCSKLFAISPSVKSAIIICTLYLIGTICWLPAIYYGKNLSTVGSMWNILAAISTIFLGLVIFQEHITKLQYTGLIMTIIGIILLNL